MRELSQDSPSIVGSMVLAKAQQAGWVLSEHDIGYHPRAAGTASKISGSIKGSLKTAHDFAKVLP